MIPKIKNMTIQKALSQSAAQLNLPNIDTASLDASLLLSHVLGVSRSKLLTMHEEIIRDKDLSAFRALIDRRLKGECIAYIVGKKEFWGLDFFVNPSVLVPRPDTEILVEAALEQIKVYKEKGSARILDLCTGSGAIAIAIKHEIPELEIHAADISAEALETAKYNARQILSNNNDIVFYRGDLFDALSSSSNPLLFDTIISNPPYIPTDKIKTLSLQVQYEPRLALDGGQSGLDIIKRIIKEAPNYIKRGGCLIMEADPYQMEDMEILLANSGFCNIIKYKDLAGLERVIGGIYG
ncbi:MAG: peptide chain release factor N(5)-glutamine methyltransferase [Treponema sp.]|jgi:release factor glutamine methyltransferase|nr:peptide chain release factor N(5)-glutamine methyltransferase [Treponema sp.]